MRSLKTLAAPPKEKPGLPGKNAPNAEEVLLKYWPQISFRVKNSIGRSTPDWEDVGSEILLSVIEAIRKGSFRGESSLETFIYSITTHKIVDHIRRKKRVLEPIPEPVTGFDPHAQVEKQEQVRMVAESLRRLKPRQADILYLHYYLDLSRNEIAQIYNISPGRVGVLMATARNTLKKLMKKLGPRGS